MNLAAAVPFATPPPGSAINKVDARAINEKDLTSDINLILMSLKEIKEEFATVVAGKLEAMTKVVAVENKTLKTALAKKDKKITQLEDDKLELQDKLKKLLREQNCNWSESKGKSTCRFMFAKSSDLCMIIITVMSIYYAYINGCIYHVINIII